MSLLMRQFDGICATNGDDTAFYTSHYTSDHGGKRDSDLLSVGFSELKENIDLIASELYNRHSIRRITSSSSSSASTTGTCSTTPLQLPTEEFMKEARSKCVIIVSDQPSAGEAAAVMACTRLRTTFLPISLNGPHRTNDSRIRLILKENPPLAAIVIITVPDVSFENRDDDWETKPALSSNEFDVDSHPTIIRLNRFGVHRIVSVKAQDGSVIGPMAGIADSSSEISTLDIQEDGQDPMYILYTSGSTSSPKAVLQTYSGLWNRICWQWKTFPFVQQMRRKNGYRETINLLDHDGIVSKHSAKRFDINDIVLRRTSLSFVDSMAEIFGTLLGGAALFCPLFIEGIEESQIMPSLRLSSMLDIASEDGLRVTRMTCLPSQLDQAFRHHEKREDDWTTTLDLVVVSGEPCMRSLPLVFDQKMFKEKAILVNLYGQTESSGDVSCLVASSGNLEIPLSRFPEAHKYIWNRSSGEVDGGDFIKKCSLSLIPIGLPIDGHDFTIKPMKESASHGVGCIYVRGPGIALGYSNNRVEMLANFSIYKSDSEIAVSKKSILFNTMDIAFQDSNGFIFVIGRAPLNSEDAVGNEGIGCSLTRGKLNGVMVHVAAIEEIFIASLKEVLSRNKIGNESPCVTGILHNDVCKGDCKSAIFIDVSSFPLNTVTVKTKSNEISILNASDLTFNASGMTFQDVTTLTRSQILQTNHPSMVPHFIHLISRMPTNGAAGKVDRSGLIEMISLDKVAKEKLSTYMGNERESKDVSLEIVILAFSEIFNLKKENIRRRCHVTFPELGGDSMMAINASHRILKYAHERGTITTDNQRINASDVMQLQIHLLAQILRDGRDNLPKAKKARLLDDRDDVNDVLAGLPYLPTVYDCNTDSSPNNDMPLTISKSWKIGMSMCVDSRPLFINNERDSFIISGSQGGDLLCASPAGRIFSRTSVHGKIEGDLTYLEQTSQPHAETIVYVPAYTHHSHHTSISTTTQGRGDREDESPLNGHIHAFKLSRSNTLDHVWSYSTKGEIKCKPGTFIHSFPAVDKNDDSTNTRVHRLVVAAYDGSLSYLDAMSGSLLQCDNLGGGAIHADPIVFKHGESVSVIVASCTWKGKITLLTLAKDTMQVKWNIDIWTPIYASPFHYARFGVLSIILCAVDGSVRSLNCDDGEENWIIQAGSKPIFTQCCSIKTNQTISTDTHCDNKAAICDTNRDHKDSSIDSIIFGSNDGKLRCIHTLTGKMHWIIDANAPILSSPICTEQHIICATTAGDVIVFTVPDIPLSHYLSSEDTPNSEVDDTTSILISDAPRKSVRLDGEIFSNPVLKNNEVYFGCRDSCLYKLKLNVVI